MSQKFQIIEKLIAQGALAASGEFERKRVRLTNQLTLVSLTVVFIFIALSLAVGSLQNAILQIPTLFALALPPIVLNRYHHFIAARLALILGTSLIVTIDACIGGRIESHQLYFMPIAMGAGMLFRANEYRLLGIALSFPLICHMTLEFNDFSLLSDYFPEQTQNILIRYFNTTVSYFVAAFIGWRFSALFIQSELRARNSAKMVALGEMSAGISHEINNPLTIISVSVDAARRKIERGALHISEIDEIFSRIKQSVLRISRIIDGLRKFSRQGSHDPIVFVDVHKIIESTLALLKSPIHQKQIQIEIIATDSYEIQCREADILHALVNIVHNAIDAVSGQEIRKISVAWDIKNSGLELSVTDSGVGIPSDLIDKLGQPFFTTKDADSGTGLGLSIATGLVRANNGSLELDRSSKNTRFVLRFDKFRLKNGKELPAAA